MTIKKLFYSITLLAAVVGFRLAAEPITATSVANQLKSVVDTMPGIKITPVGNVVLIKGEVEDLAAYEQLLTLAESLRDAGNPEGRIAVRSIATLTESAKTRAAKKLQDEIGLPQINVRFVNQSIFLEGVAKSDFEADRSVAIVKAMTGETRTKGADTRDPAKIEESVGAVKIPIVDLMRVAPTGKRGTPKR